jgi:predicted small lipoprotein YifL
MSRLARLLLLLLLVLPVFACGKKNAPVAPPDEPNTYPRPYPRE